MSLVYTPYMLPALISGLVALALAVVMWRRRGSVGTRSFGALMLAVALWAVASSLETADRTLEGKLFWINVEYVGITLAPVFWYTFSLEYLNVGRRLTIAQVLPVFFMPLVTIVLSWTNASHGLMRRADMLNLSGPVPTLVTERGPAFWVHTAYSYLLMGAGVYLLLRMMFRSERLYRRQAVALLVAALLPWVANVIYLVSPRHVLYIDLTPVAFTVSGVAVAWGIARYGIVKIVPAAYDAVLEGLPDVLVVLDDQGRVVELNQRALDVVRRPLSALLGRPLEEVMPGEAQTWRDVLLARTTEVVMTVDGDERRFDVSGSSLVDGRGRVTGRVLVLRDTTERGRAEQDLRDARAQLERRVEERTAELQRTNVALASAHDAAELGRRRLGAVLAALPVAVIIVDAQGRVADVNPAAEHLWGGPLPRDLTAEEFPVLLQARIAGAETLLPPEEMPLVRALRRREPSTGMEMEIVGLDGVARSVLAYAVPIGDATDGQVGAVSVHVDITRLKQTDAALRAANETLERRVAERTGALAASEARFRAIFEDAGLGIILADGDCRIMDANATSARILGYSLEELRRLSCAEITAPEDWEREQRLLDELRSGERDVYRLQQRYLHADGHKVWVGLTASLIRDPQGAPAYTLRLLEDLTERRRTEEALLWAEKLAVTGALAASFAHEINNPLQAIMGVLSLTLESPAIPEDTRRYLTLAREELRRAARIVAQLRDVHRPVQAGVSTEVDLNVIVDRVLEITHLQAQKRRVTVDWQPAGNLPRVPARPDQVQQVFVNLVLNALDAMPDGGCLTVRAAPTVVPPGVTVSFHDTGPGLSDAARANLFNPFFSDKPTGTGLGLFVSQTIMRVHHGRIEATSVPGQGTTFTVWFPRESGEQEAPAVYSAGA